MVKVYVILGVYIEEKSVFFNLVVFVVIVVLVFIGYIEKVIRDKKSIKNILIRIFFFGEYLLYFGGGFKIIY